MKGYPISASVPAQFTDAPPKQADVVVIGGGIIGVTTALSLARAGQSTVLLEKGRIAGEQSGRNWGWIRQQGRDRDEVPLMIEARRRWKSLAHEAGFDFGLREKGVTYLARTKAEIERFENWMSVAEEFGLDTRLVAGGRVEQLIPGMANRYLGALHTASDMQAEPWLAVPALAKLAHREGVRICENCSARALDIAAGRIAGVISEAGRIETQNVVLAGGAWSSLFLRRHGIQLPQLSVRSTVAVLDAPDMPYAGGASDGDVSFRARSDGGYTVAAGGRYEIYVGPDAYRAFPKYWAQIKSDPFNIALYPTAPRGFPDAWFTPRGWSADQPSPFERIRVLDPEPNTTRVKKAARAFTALFPNLGDVSVRASWAGMIDTLPDIVPVIDHVESLPGLTIGTGMSGHGFGIGPEVGHVLATLVLGNTTGHDLTRFRFDRFTDGSPIRPGPAL